MLDKEEYLVDFSNELFCVSVYFVNSEHNAGIERFADFIKVSTVG